MDIEKDFNPFRLANDIIQPQKDLEDNARREPTISAKRELKNYLNKIVRSPIAIIGLVAVIVPILVSIFPHLVTEYSFEEAMGYFDGAWDAPSPDHPLGQSRFGRDVLALVVYGTRDSLIFGFGAVIIGLIGGLIFGLLGKKLNRKIHTSIQTRILIFYIILCIFLAMIFIGIFGLTSEHLMLPIGLLFIPSFTQKIANAEFRMIPLGKTIISYVPLFAGFAIFLYVFIGFFGFNDPLTIQLSQLINEARNHMFDAYWAIFWPGLITFLLLVGLFVLHIGLVKLSR